MMLYNVLNPCIIRTYESGNPDSNRGPRRPERRALPAALIPVNAFWRKKKLPKTGSFSASGGARTRDLRRDRPAR